MKTLWISVLSLCTAVTALAQMDTVSYSRERAVLKKLIHDPKAGATIDCPDFIAVGPKGDISFSHQQWRGVQSKLNVVFESVQPVPGNEYIRIYEGTMAVVNFLADVKLLVNGSHVNIKVRRLEVYHKTSSGWCRVAGQGTEVDEKLFPIGVKEE